MLKKITAIGLSACLLLNIAWAESSQNKADESVKQQISALRSGTLEVPESSAQDQNLELTKRFNDQTLKQKNDIAALEKQIQTLSKDLTDVQKRTEGYKKDLDSVNSANFSSLSLAELTKRQDSIARVRCSNFK